MQAIGALAAGWSTTVVHALSGAALTFEELRPRWYSAPLGQKAAQSTDQAASHPC